MSRTNTQDNVPAQAQEFVTFTVAGQLFGVPVLRVQDILVPDRIANVPLAPPEVRGSINLRGRIVTVIDMRTRLALGAAAADAGRRMAVTVEGGADLYTLLVDDVGDVIRLSTDQYEANPSTLDPLWRELACGAYRLETELMVVLDVDRLLDIPAAA